MNNELINDYFPEKGPVCMTGAVLWFSRVGVCFTILVMLFLAGCDKGAWNNPYPASDEQKNILYSSFSERPKHFDPARSYSANEYAFIAQIYEPPLQYHFLKRPYELVPLTAESVPHPRYFDHQDRELGPEDDHSELAYSVYDIHIQPGIHYQPHPAFAQDEHGNYLYHNLTSTDLENKFTLSDFPQTGSRELIAADYVNQIKRLAHPRIQSPIFGVMSEYIMGLNDFSVEVDKAYQALSEEQGEKNPYLDLSRYPLTGAEVIDRYIYRIKVDGKYPQLLYWLAMPFFAPMPPEAERFYSQPGMDEKNLSLDWFPVGTGPYMLTENNPNRVMALERNPNFHDERYPVEGEASDQPQGFLDDAGKPLPFIEKAVYSLEKENISYWNKFLQGYYDTSGISSDSFDQAISMAAEGEATLTEDMQAKDIGLLTSVSTSTFYMGFNMYDPVIGGYSERQRKLRQAISIAIDYEEYISIFANGRGIAAQGPLPPGIFGYRDGQQGINPYVYDWVNGQSKRKSIEEAKRLLLEADYGEGVDVRTGKPLVLYFDATGSGPDSKARFDWYRKQFQKIDLQLEIRNTDYNRFQEKMRKGTAQIFSWGWNADYPDPENFMFLLYGPNGKVNHDGENAANYDSADINLLFEQMKNMDNSAERQIITDKIVEIVRRDAPWVWGFHPKNFALYHVWYHNAKPNLMANNSLKYKRIDPVLREQRRAEWNKPIIWPVVLIFIVLVLILVPAIIVYRRKEHHAPELGHD